MFVCFGATTPQWARASSFTRFLDHTQRCTTVGRTPLDERSARHRALYLTTHNNHNRQTSMPPVGFEPTISAGERPQTHASDRAATGTSRVAEFKSKKMNTKSGNYRGADKSLARPRRKQATVIKLLTFTSHSKKIQKVVRPTRSHGSNNLHVGRKMATFPLSFQSGQAKD